MWELRPTDEARRRTGKPLFTVRWADVNKGDDLNPNVRSRLVACQIRQAGEEAIFGPTPPLEALRSTISFAATDLPERLPHVRNPQSERRTQVSAIDIPRACFNSLTEGPEPTCVMLPPERPDHSRLFLYRSKKLYCFCIFVASRSDPTYKSFWGRQRPFLAFSGGRP